MNTNTADYTPPLAESYRRRDVDGLIRSVTELTQHPSFPRIYGRLRRERKIAGSGDDRIEELARALVEETEQSIRAADEKSHPLESYYEIADLLKNKFGQEIGAIYLQTVHPNDLVAEARSHLDDEIRDTAGEKLSGTLVVRLKEELLRAEKGRSALVAVLQKYSNFPIGRASSLSQTLIEIQSLTLDSEHYTHIVPLLRKIASIGGSSLIDRSTATVGGVAKEYQNFDDYATSGEEPPLWQQVTLRLAITELLDSMHSLRICSTAKYRELGDSVSRVWRPTAPTPLDDHDRVILEDALRQINGDVRALSKRLATTFVGEYRIAERQMEILQGVIESQLADTMEFLLQVDPEDENHTDDEKEKIRIAEQKMIGLEGVFDYSSHQARSSRKSYIELERVALGVSAHMSVEQIVEWIRIYSVLLCNSDFVSLANEKIDFSMMRKQISDLSTYYLIQNLALLRGVIDKALSKPEEEKKEDFRTFNQALRIKLQSLMKVGKQEEKSLGELVEELGFLHNETCQFLIAETFKGFQSLVDAFDVAAKGGFVKDRDLLLKESRSLYDEICTKCLKNFVHAKPIVKPRRRAPRLGHEPGPWWKTMFRKLSLRG